MDTQLKLGIQKMLYILLNRAVKGYKYGKNKNTKG